MFSADSSKAGPPAAVWHLAERAAFHIWIIHHLFDPPLKCHHNNDSELASVSFFLQPCGRKSWQYSSHQPWKCRKFFECQSKFVFQRLKFHSLSLLFWVAKSEKKSGSYCNSSAFYSLSWTIISSHLLVKLFDVLYLNSYPVRPWLVWVMDVTHWWQKKKKYQMSLLDMKLPLKHVTIRQVWQIFYKLV